MNRFVLRVCKFILNSIIWRFIRFLGRQIRRVLVLGVVLAIALVIALNGCSVSAQEYNMKYPSNLSHNSGAPIWIHARVERLGEVLVILDPDTDLQSFGFDSPYGYNLINNTSQAIKGRMYVAGSSTSYAAQFPSFYMLQAQTGTNAGGQKFYEDYFILDIIGTTLDPVDFTNADRDNDYYDGLPVDYRYLIIVFVAGGLVVALLNFFIFRRGHR